MRPRKCPECGDKFLPIRQMQPCCEKDACKEAFAIRHAEATRKRRQMQREKAERIKGIEDRKVIKAELEKLKTRNEYIKEAQAEFNAFCRERDRLSGYPCISSGKQLDWSGNNVDAGHYRSRGSAPHLRFDERNCHAQSKHDNRYLSGNVVDYRIGLIKRIGLQAVEELEADQTPRKYTIEELKSIKAYYIKKRKELINGR